MKALQATRHLLALGTTLLVLGASHLEAQDAVVPGDFATISSAVANASDTNGDGLIDILVSAGTYVENVRINRSNLTLRGESAAKTILQGAGGIDTLRARDVSGISVASLTVIGIGNGNSDDAIDFNRVQNCSVDGVITSGGDTGIDLSNATDCKILSSMVSGALTEGIKVQRSQRVDVAFNVSSANGHQGIDVDESDSVRVGRNDARGNGDSGFRDRFSNNNLYVQNISSGNVDNGWRLENTNGATLRNNTASDNRSNGLRMEETSNSLITGNSLTDNREWGIRRKDWQADDFAAAAGVQSPPGDNDVSGNGNGGVRND